MNKEIKYKFKIGDKVEIVKSGYGCGTESKGEVVTILELGTYSGKPAYRITTDHKGITNSKDGLFGGMCLEESFELVKSILNNKFRDGEEVIVTNYSNLNGGYIHGNFNNIPRECKGKVHLNLGKPPSTEHYTVELYNTKANPSWDDREGYNGNVFLYYNKKYLIKIKSEINNNEIENGNQSINNKNRKVNGKAIKFERTLPTIRRGEKPRGIGIRVERRRVTTRVGHLSNKAITSTI